MLLLPASQAVRADEASGRVSVDLAAQIDQAARAQPAVAPLARDAGRLAEEYRALPSDGGRAHPAALQGLLLRFNLRERQAVEDHLGRVAEVALALGALREELDRVAEVDAVVDPRAEEVGRFARRAACLLRESGVSPGPAAGRLERNLVLLHRSVIRPRVDTAALALVVAGHRRSLEESAMNLHGLSRRLEAERLRLGGLAYDALDQLARARFAASDLGRPPALSVATARLSAAVADTGRALAALLPGPQRRG